MKICKIKNLSLNSKIVWDNSNFLQKREYRMMKALAENKKYPLFKVFFLFD